MLFDSTNENLISSDRIESYGLESTAEELDPKCTILTVKQGSGSVIVWGCVTRQRVGKLCVLDRIMNRFYYRDILEQNLQTINQSF